MDRHWEMIVTSGAACVSCDYTSLTGNQEADKLAKVEWLENVPAEDMVAWLHNEKVTQGKESYLVHNEEVRILTKIIRRCTYM